MIASCSPASSCGSDTEAGRPGRFSGERLRRRVLVQFIRRAAACFHGRRNPKHGSCAESSVKGISSDASAANPRSMNLPLFAYHLVA